MCNVHASGSQHRFWAPQAAKADSNKYRETGKNLEQKWCLCWCWHQLSLLKLSRKQNFFLTSKWYHRWRRGLTDMVRVEIVRDVTALPRPRAERLQLALRLAHVGGHEGAASQARHAVPRIHLWQYKRVVYSSTYLAMGFANVRAGTWRVPGTRPNISESHSEISTRVPFCIALISGGRTSGWRPWRPSKCGCRATRRDPPAASTGNTHQY